jgi:hypothetical protein
VAEPRQASVPREAGSDRSGRVAARVLKRGHRVRRSRAAGGGAQGDLGGETGWSHRRWPESAGDRPAPGGSGIAWTGACACGEK